MSENVLWFRQLTNTFCLCYIYLYQFTLCIFPFTLWYILNSCFFTTSIIPDYRLIYLNHHSNSLQLLTLYHECTSLKRKMDNEVTSICILNKLLLVFLVLIKPKQLSNETSVEKLVYNIASQIQLQLQNCTAIKLRLFTEFVQWVRWFISSRDIWSYVKVYIQETRQRIS